MADRKVLVKYYPPDFDPEKLAQKGRLYRNYEAKRRKGGVKLMNVRFMFPFTMCCATCNEFIYIGTKFNSRVEKIKGEDYLGIPIWRFYGRCPHCRAEITFKTDPQNTEYILESGGTRTYDQRKDAALAEMSLKEQLEEELTDSVRALAHKTDTTANELLALEQLDELRKINKRFLNRESTLDDALAWLQKGGVDDNVAGDHTLLKDGLDTEAVADLEKAKEEMEELKFKRLAAETAATDSSDEDTPSVTTRNSTRSDDGAAAARLNGAEKLAANSVSGPPSSAGTDLPTSRPAFKVIRKTQTGTTHAAVAESNSAGPSVSENLTLLSGYGSSSST